MQPNFKIYKAVNRGERKEENLVSYWLEPLTVCSIGAEEEIKPIK